jgi:hypothetical protein
LKEHQWAILWYLSFWFWGWHGIGFMSGRTVGIRLWKLWFRSCWIYD